MDAGEYLRKKRLLAQFEALEKSAAYGELLAEIQREHGNCIQGLRNRRISVAERQEFLEGADVTERLAGYVAKRIEGLRGEVDLVPEEMAKIELGDPAD